MEVLVDYIANLYSKKNRRLKIRWRLLVYLVSLQFVACISAIQIFESLS